ncbi:MAG: hypothetical protein LRY55_14955 [Leadbetterella sp.]|nr:hypothetical protein [Leadbetterella sp.]
MSAEANFTFPEKHWTDLGEKILRGISDGIELGKIDSTQEISSIPDIYARPLIFQNALNNSKHPLHDRAYQEWKGLISLLALRKILSPDDEGKGISVVCPSFNHESGGAGRLSYGVKKISAGFC